MTTPGWYPDPYGTSQLRYWDGTTWTEHVNAGAQAKPNFAPYAAPALVTLPWYKRKVTIAVGAVIALLVVIGAIGAATGSPKTKNASTTITSGTSNPTSQIAPFVQVTHATTSAPSALTTSSSAGPPPSPVVTTTSAPPPAPVSVAPTTKPIKITTAAPKPPVTSAAPPAPAEQTFANCTAMNQVYPHGIGRAGAVDHVSGSSKPVTDFYVDTALYNANESHDGDGDGIACEKH